MVTLEIKRAKNRKGQSAIEFMIMLPLILFFIFAVIQLILVANAYLVVDYAAFASSRVFFTMTPGQEQIGARRAAERICGNLPGGNLADLVTIRDDTTFGFPTMRTQLVYRLPVRLPLLGSLGPAANVRGTSTVGLPRW